MNRMVVIIDGGHSLWQRSRMKLCMIFQATQYLLINSDYASTASVSPGSVLSTQKSYSAANL